MGELRRLWWYAPLRRRRVLQEIEDHLRASAAAIELGGLDRPAAEREAIARLGLTRGPSRLPGIAAVLTAALLLGASALVAGTQLSATGIRSVTLAQIRNVGPESLGVRSCDSILALPPTAKIPGIAAAVGTVIAIDPRYGNLIAGRAGSGFVCRLSAGLFRYHRISP